MILNKVTNMKRTILMIIVACMAGSLAMAQKVQRVLAPGQDPVKFTTRRNLAPGQYAYRLDSIVNVASYGKSVFRFAYDTQGRIAEMLLISTNFTPEKHIYHYDKRGFCVGEDEYNVVNGKDVLLAEFRATYSDEGRMVKKETKFYDKDGQLRLNATDSYTYDKQGNCLEHLSQSLMTPSNTLSKSKTTYAYNALNQRIEEVIYGHKTQEDEFFPNITTTMEYDKKGRVNHQTDITSSGLGEDGKYETFIEYTEQNGQVVRETHKRKNPNDDQWAVEVKSYAYDTYGNLVREDLENDNTYSGSTNYYYDLATKAENIQGVDWYDKPGMTLLRVGLLCDACGHKYRVTRINGVNASGDFEGLSGSNTSGSDVRFYYSEVK